MRCRKVQFAKLTRAFSEFIFYFTIVQELSSCLFVCFFSFLMSPQVLFKQCPCKQFLLSSKLKLKLYFQSTINTDCIVWQLQRKNTVAKLGKLSVLLWPPQSAKKSTKLKHSFEFFDYFMLISLAKVMYALLLQYNVLI